MDDEPWGFAPFHYGRWAWYRSVWLWVPGPIHVRPVYAPALVAWVGGIGWFPQGPTSDGAGDESRRGSQTYPAAWAESIRKARKRSLIPATEPGAESAEESGTAAAPELEHRQAAADTSPSGEAGPLLVPYSSPNRIPRDETIWVP